MKLTITISDIDTDKDKSQLTQLLGLMTEWSKEEDEEDGEEIDEEVDEGEEEEEEEEAEESSQTKTYVNVDANRKGKIANYETRPELNCYPYEIVLLPFIRIAVASWKDVLVELAEHLIKTGQLKKNTTHAFGNSQIPLVSPQKKGNRPLVQLSNGLYMDASHSSKDLVRRACALLEACGGKKEDFIVYYA